MSDESAPRVLGTPELIDMLRFTQSTIEEDWTKNPPEIDKGDEEVGVKRLAAEEAAYSALEAAAQLLKECGDDDPAATVIDLAEMLDEQGVEGEEKDPTLEEIIKDFSQGVLSMTKAALEDAEDIGADKTVVVERIIMAIHTSVLDPVEAYLPPGGPLQGAMKWIGRLTKGLVGKGLSGTEAERSKVAKPVWMACDPALVLVAWKVSLLAREPARSAQERPCTTPPMRLPFMSPLSPKATCQGFRSRASTPSPGSRWRTCFMASSGRSARARLPKSMAR